MSANKNTALIPLSVITRKLIGSLICQLLLFCCVAHAQEEKKYVREGNKAYSNSKYKEAEDQYLKALGLNPGSRTGEFNLADTYYKQGKYKEAAAKFEELSKTITGDDELSARAYHNLGNSLLKDKKYEESIKAYEKALTLNSKDDDTRYNLEYAKQMIAQEQKKQKQNKDKDKDKDKDKKDKDKDKKDKGDKDKKDDKKDKDKDKKDKGDKDKDKDKPDNKGKPDKDEQNHVSKDAAQKMLNEVNNNERKVQNKLKKQKEATVRGGTIEKDW